MRWPTSPSSVAENSIVWCGPMQWRRIHSTCGVNPSSAMRSASSSTTTSTPSRGSTSSDLMQVDQPQRRGDDDLDAERAAARPGRAGWPRRTRRARAGRRGRRPARAPRRPGSPAHASARARGRAAERRRPASVIRASIGTPKASVLPDPVRARPQTSRPSIATGMAAVWIMNGWANPAAASPASTRVGHAECGEAGRRVDGRQGRRGREVGGPSADRVVTVAGDCRSGSVGVPARSPAAGGSPPMSSI